ncbi:MAG: thiolase family protein [Ardenticatenaceae bacterium]|nr:thiolase family protein [Ardenticatenaceae bacterium]
MGEVFIVEAVRTPVGKRNGALSAIHPVELGARVLREIVARTEIGPELVEDVIVGCVTQTDQQGANIGRLAVLQAGFPVNVPAVSVNRMCGSSQQAVHFAAQAIAAGDIDLAIAAGVESMSRVPMGSDFPMEWPADFPFALVPQGLSAEMVAERWGLTREALDDYSFESHVRAARATREGRFRREMMPLVPSQACESTALVHDEGIRFEPDRARMAALRPPFKDDGVVTAGNSSQISDGAAALLLASARALEANGLRPRARIVSRAVVGTDPVLMLSGPIPATRKVLARAGLRLGDIDLFEVNEAFASVVLAWQLELGVPLERVNVNGGAIALGHPLGASGTRLMATLLHELERTGGRYGLQTMCIGHGMATATIIERLDPAR